MGTPTTRRVGVIGSGVAGLTSAYVISASAEVTLIEADDRLGGHADTHEVPTAHGVTHIDTGFIVHNEKTYPTLMRLFAELGVPTQPSDMSMSVRTDEAHGGAGLEWAGALGRRGLFPTWRNAVRPAYLRMLVEIPRFHRRARRLLEQTDGSAEAGADGQTLGAFLEEGRFSAYFRRHFMAPLVAAVWSCDPAVSLEYPARYLFAFLRHHGMLSVFGSPQWRTVTGGSRQYVDRVAAALAARGSRVLLETKVTSVLETADGVEVTDGNGTVHRFDAVVLAAHPGQALAMLADPSGAQREVLGAMPYSQNVAQLHTDTSLLPRHRGAWASWNQWTRPGSDRVTVTYDLTRLMRLPQDRTDGEDGTRYLVTLGAPDLVDPATVIATRHYEHPLYTPESVAAQRRAAELDSDRLAFAGAWKGWGFHEDGARSGLAAAERLGFTWVAPPAAVEAPAVYATTIRHTRREPLEHRFSNRSSFWLVDLDDLPDHGLWGRFEAHDHLGDPSRSIRENVEAFLAREGVDVPVGRILMAANARALGYCFNPISLFWCYDASGGPAATVVEVHNTYGDRHAYLLRADPEGRGRVDKAMYVSPFHGVDGHYEVTAPAPTDRLVVTVRLVTAAGAVFDASLRGTRSAARPIRTAPAAIRGALLIRMQGVWLWARRLPIQPRPTHHQEGVR
ncbi:FAD-dependent oxidoreductase [Nocardioides pocheonensis]|uniref:FAD-dependent oxidoreductase n=1 Tax=Nocardioides pocheonensis TaxID=661485 RepID=A0A3N0GTD2_9ACTN|nr:FAD-dependent oxidoreductase [Nocardioides pocheonensis]RNM15717.1 FAD-dependent oxidoreductase [Nocardioides pocheonensis]